MVGAEMILARNDLPPFPLLWHIQYSHRVMFFRLAAARPERWFAQTRAARRDVIVMLCTTPPILTTPRPSASPRLSGLPFNPLPSQRIALHECSVLVAGDGYEFRRAPRAAWFVNGTGSSLRRVEDLD